MLLRFRTGRRLKTWNKAGELGRVICANCPELL